MLSTFPPSCLKPRRLCKIGCHSMWKCRVVKIDIDIVFLRGKLNINILIRNRLIVPSLARIVPHNESFVDDYEELQGIIEG